MGFEPSPLKLDLLQPSDLIFAFNNVLHVFLCSDFFEL